MKGDSYIQTNARISCTEDNRVEIGRGCQISHNLTIYTENRIADQDFSETDRENESGDVIIGDDVWIGHSVFITNNTKIGDDSVIGAKSVVTRDIPPIQSQ
jgi:maltose O-acetyltransferase